MNEPIVIEEPQNDKNICDFNLIRSGHLHTDDWNLVVLALESLVIDLEKSEGRLYGNMLERAEGLRSNIRTMILEINEPVESNL